ncbi:hypothetical protein QR680_019355 [Steinernema hermaphroditum]|uniref:G-protein coupled receptors family 1 profile domain-containing protein n=1 Tax=Steinernema hermaphroditum TaxID=289476 RepID=A0AA39GQ24_9BILA|nr:hypothetical protein QR680_019355 [Steinernema hermaphroditum]
MRPLPVAMVVIEMIGIFGNVNIIVATIRKKQLKTKIHMMISVMAVMNLISIGYECSSAIRMFLHMEQMSRTACFRFIWVYLVVFTAEMVVALAVAVDRLIAVSFPLSYEKASSQTTLPAILLVAVAIGAAPVIASVFYLDDEILPVCNPPIVIPWEVFFYWNGLVIVVAVSILVTYGIVLVQMHRLEKAQTNLRQLRISKTLTSTIVVFASTKFTAIIITLILPFLFCDYLRDTLATFTVLLVSVEYGINYWLLMFRREDTYRKAFLEQLRWRKIVLKEAWSSEG